MTRKTVLDLQQMKTGNQSKSKHNKNLQVDKKSKITMVTAYDYTMARCIDQTDIDMVLVGDSVGMVFQGHQDTLGVTMEHMIYHAQVVNRGLSKAHLTVDMPFMSYQVSTEDAIRNAGRLMKEGGAQSVKIEGFHPEIIKKMVSIGIPVVAHLGLTPQSVHALGGFKVQGREEQAQQVMIEQAIELAKAGAFMLVLEMVPAPLAQKITKSIDIPTIGIGAGPHCDGQVLVCNDLLGMQLNFTPRFLKRYATLEENIVDALRNYQSEVQKGVFPDQQHSFGKIDSNESRDDAIPLYGK